MATVVGRIDRSLASIPLVISSIRACLRRPGGVSFL
jgi:hypothetical protein